MRYCQHLPRPSLAPLLLLSLLEARECHLVGRCFAAPFALFRFARFGGLVGVSRVCCSNRVGPCTREGIRVGLEVAAMAEDWGVNVQMSADVCQSQRGWVDWKLAVHRSTANSSPPACPARLDRASCRLRFAFSVASMFFSFVLMVRTRAWRSVSGGTPVRPRGHSVRNTHSMPRSTSGMPMSILALRVTLPSSSSRSFLPFSASSMSANLYFSATLYSSSRGSNGLLDDASPAASSPGPRFLASSASMYASL